MKPKHQNYDEALRTLSASAQSNETLLNQLPPEAQSKLLEDILLGMASDGFIAYLRRQHGASARARLMSGQELAFDWLCQKDKAWLDSQHETVARLFKTHYLREDSHNSIQCYSRINLMVDRCKGGLTVPFLKRCLEEDADALHRQPLIETELYILIAKLGQADGVALNPDDDFWKQVKASVEKKPWLIAVLCYIYRTRKFAAFLYMLEDIDEKLRDVEHDLDDLEKVNEYIMLYLRQALYQNLTSEDEDHLGRYTTFEKGIQSNWLKELMIEAMSAKTMEAANKALKRYAAASQKPDREESHKDHFAYIEKDIDK